MQAGQCAQCCSYLARGLSLPLIGGGKTNSVPAKRAGAAGSVFITAKKKALFPASPQRLFITHTRGWRKCSICWVRPSTHTVYKLRAFTCRVPEIKHTHTQKREEFCIGPGALPLPCCLFAPAGVGSHSGIPHYLSPFPASSAGNSSASVFLQSHLESVMRGVSRQSRAAGMCSPCLGFSAFSCGEILGIRWGWDALCLELLTCNSCELIPVGFFMCNGGIGAVKALGCCHLNPRVSAGGSSCLPGDDGVSIPRGVPEPQRCGIRGRDQWDVGSGDLRGLFQP